MDWPVTTGHRSGAHASGTYADSCGNTSGCTATEDAICYYYAGTFGDQTFPYEAISVIGNQGYGQNNAPWGNNVDCSSLSCPDPNSGLDPGATTSCRTNYNYTGSHLNSCAASTTTTTTTTSSTTTTTYVPCIPGGTDCSGGFGTFTCFDVATDCNLSNTTCAINQPSDFSTHNVSCPTTPGTDTVCSPCP